MIMGSYRGGQFRQSNRVTTVTRPGDRTRQMDKVAPVEKSVIRKPVHQRPAKA